MQLELRIRDAARGDLLRAYIERRLRFALCRFANRVGRVVMLIGRLNGVKVPGNPDAISRPGWCHLEP